LWAAPSLRAASWRHPPASRRSPGGKRKPRRRAPTDPTRRTTNRSGSEPPPQPAAFARRPEALFGAGHPLCGRAGRRVGVAAGGQSLVRDRAIAMRSLNTPCPASCGPAPGPMIVTSPSGSARQTTALLVPSMVASGSSPGTSSGHARSDVPRSVWLGERERCDVLESRPAGGGPVYLRASDIGDSAAGDLLAS
jgi:hypothetical protein